MTTVNWVLGILSALVWIGPVAWYFRNDIRTMWVARHDKWLRPD